MCYDICGTENHKKIRNMYYNHEDLNYINRELSGVWPGWTAVKLLGRGSFGAVYEINRYIRSKAEKAAMKVIRVPGSDDEIMQLRMNGVPNASTEEYYDDLIEGIQNEITIMQRLVGNSHLVSYEDYSICKRQNGIGWDIYIRMELLTPLTDYMEACLLDEPAALKMARDIALGLRDCHKNGIIHRDIKPQNIFINDTGSFKLGDFGVSKAMPGTQGSMSFKGTLSYMPPEVFHMQSTDARSDIYSLGLVLYQCLNDNRLPFLSGKITSESIETARQRRFAGESVPEPAHGSADLKAIALRAIAADPQERFQSASEMYRALMSVYKTEYTSYYQAEFREEHEQNIGIGVSGSADTNHSYSNTSNTRIGSGVDILSTQKIRDNDLNNTNVTGGNDYNVKAGGGKNPDRLFDGLLGTQSSPLLAVLIISIIALAAAIVAAGVLLLRKPSKSGSTANRETGSVMYEKSGGAEGSSSGSEEDGRPESEVYEETGGKVEEEPGNTVNGGSANAAEEHGNEDSYGVNNEPDSEEPLSPDEQGYIGINCTTVTPETSEAYNIPPGVYVSQIYAGGGAANSDLREGDIITGFNGKTISSVEDLQDVLQYYKAGRKVTLTVEREDDSHTYNELFVEVTLGTRDSMGD